MVDDEAQPVDPAGPLDEEPAGTESSRVWTYKRTAVATAGVVVVAVLVMVLAGLGSGAKSDVALEGRSSNASSKGVTSTTTTRPSSATSVPTGSSGGSSHPSGSQGPTSTPSEGAATLPPRSAPLPKPSVSGTPDPQTTVTTAPKTPPTLPSTAPLPGQQILQALGAGSQDVLLADAPAKWSVGWSYSCSSGQAPGFTYTLSGPAGSAHLVGPSQTGVTGSGTEQYHGAGEFTFHVTTSCNWTIRATAT